MATKPRNAVKASNGKITPLWIVAAFVTLTESVLGIALTQVTNGVQIALTAFVIIFALFVSSMFFLILWSRPYVFYSPAEYGGIDPKGFIDAMRGKIPDQLVHQISEAEAKPTDNTVQFVLIDSLIDEAIRQHVILMNEKHVSIPILDSFGTRFETGKANNSWMSGGISGREIGKRLGGSQLIDVDLANTSIHLTELGQKFARWLVETGKRNDYYSSNLGGWGELKRPEGFSKDFFENEWGSSVTQTANATAANIKPTSSQSDE